MLNEIVFFYYLQLDVMGCTPSGFRIISKHYGKSYPKHTFHAMMFLCYPRRNFYVSDSFFIRSLMGREICDTV